MTPTPKPTPRSALDFVVQLRDSAERYFAWVVENVFASETVLQLSVGAFTLFLSFIIARPIERVVEARLKAMFSAAKQASLRDTLLNTVFPLVWLLIQSFTVMFCRRIEWPTRILEVVSVLLLAWIVIRLFTGFVANQSLSRLIAVVIWIIAALNIIGEWNSVVAVLDVTLSTEIGSLRLSAWSMLKAVAMLSLMMWLAIITSRSLDRRIRKSRTLTPSMQELVSKLMKFAFLCVAVLVSLTSVGVNLTALAVFSGALGVGIGFGLQKIVSNLLSGIILLLDRSVKPGDVIELSSIGLVDNYGWVNTLGARFVSVITRDGKEHLIPNEDMITQKVINWSYSDTNVRIKVPVRISYDSDVHKAMDLLVEAAIETPRVLESPAPRCLLMEFSENAVNLELRIWASDPNNGVANLKSAVLLKVWDKFHEHGIQFPFPQRDIHVDIREETLAAILGKKDAPASSDRRPRNRPRKPGTSKA